MSFSRMFGVALVGVSMLTGFSATAQTAPAESFPVSLERDVLIAWLRAETDLAPSAVVSIKPADLIGIRSTQPVDEGAPGQFRVQIRAEVISPQIVTQARRRSWAAEVEVDCKASQAKVRQILDYPLRNLKGEAREASTSAQWISPSPGAHLYNLISAVCDSGYRRPLAAPAATPAATPPAPSPVQRLPGADAAPIATATPRPLSNPPLRGAEPAPTPAKAAATPAKPATAADTRPAPVRATRVQTALQLGASDAEQKSLDLLAATRRRHSAQMQGLDTKVARVTVSGKIYYRALIAGFGSQSEAQALCKAIKDGGKDCLIRTDGGTKF